MTISNQTRVALYQGNSAATNFPFTFPIYESAHVEVRLYTIADNTYVTLSPSDYTATGIGPDSTGGSITYNPGGVPIPAEKMIVIYRTLPYTQETDIVNQSGFYPDVIEEQLDKIVMQIQQIAEGLGRALLIPPSSSMDEEAFSALIIELGGMIDEMNEIADWINGGSEIGTLDISGFVFATAGQTIIPITNGYTPGTIDVYRNGIRQVLGTPIGTGDLDFDCQATDGVNVVFPAAELDENDCIFWLKKRNFNVASVPAEAVTVLPFGGISSTNLQLALQELDAEKVPTARQITTSGLLTGGGALSADRAFSVPKASSAEVITGTDDTKAVTSLGVNAAIVAYGSAPSAALVSSGTTASIASLDIPLTGGYRKYQLTVSDIEPATNNQQLFARFSFDGGATYPNSATEYLFIGKYQDTGTAEALWNSTSSGMNAIAIGRNQATSGYGSLLNFFFSIGTGVFPPAFSWTYEHSYTGGILSHITAGGRRASAGAPTHIRLIFNSGNIRADARWELYGLRS